jgi:hypothetical protein
MSSLLSDEKNDLQEVSSGAETEELEQGDDIYKHQGVATTWQTSVKKSLYFDMRFLPRVVAECPGHYNICNLVRFFLVMLSKTSIRFAKEEKVLVCVVQSRLPTTLVEKDGLYVPFEFVTQTFSEISHVIETHSDGAWLRRFNMSVEELREFSFRFSAVFGKLLSAYYDTKKNYTDSLVTGMLRDPSTDTVCLVYMGHAGLLEGSGGAYEMQRWCMQRFDKFVRTGTGKCRKFLLDKNRNCGTDVMRINNVFTCQKHTDYEQDLIERLLW